MKPDNTQQHAIYASATGNLCFSRYICDSTTVLSVLCGCPWKDIGGGTIDRSHHTLPCAHRQVHDSSSASSLGSLTTAGIEQYWRGDGALQLDLVRMPMDRLYSNHIIYATV